MSQTTASDVCNTLRAFSKLPASHIELQLIVENLASLFSRTSALGDKATTNIVDCLDEIVGQIEQDEVNQAEQVTV